MREEEKTNKLIREVLTRMEEVEKKVDIIGTMIYDNLPKRKARKSRPTVNEKEPKTNVREKSFE